MANDDPQEDKRRNGSESAFSLEDKLASVALSSEERTESMNILRKRYSSSDEGKQMEKVWREIKKERSA